MKPVLFTVWGYTVSSYYAMAILGVVIGFFMAAREADREHLSRRLVINAATIAAVFGYLGARIQHIIFDGFFDIYLQKPIAMLYVWKGGLAFYGAVVFGFVSVVLYLSIKKAPVAKVLDIFTYPLALGIAIGRIGCYLNGCCFGKIADSSFSQQFLVNGLSAKKQFASNMLSSLSVPPYPVYATQLIEFGFAFAIFLFLWFWLRKHHTKPGVPFGTWLILYASGRFVVEYFRDDDRGLFFGGLLSSSQIIALMCIAAGIILLLLPASGMIRKNNCHAG